MAGQFRFIDKRKTGDLSEKSIPGLIPSSLFFDHLTANHQSTNSPVPPPSLPQLPSSLLLSINYQLAFPCFVCRLIHLPQAISATVHHRSATIPFGRPLFRHHPSGHLPSVSATFHDPSPSASVPSSCSTATTPPSGHLTPHFSLLFIHHHRSPVPFPISSVGAHLPLPFGHSHSTTVPFRPSPSSGHLLNHRSTTPQPSHSSAQLPVWALPFHCSTASIIRTPLPLFHSIHHPHSPSTAHSHRTTRPMSAETFHTIHRSPSYEF